MKIEQTVKLLSSKIEELREEIVTRQFLHLPCEEEEDQLEEFQETLNFLTKTYINQ